MELYNRNKFEMEEPLRPTLTAEDCLINIAEGETVSSLSHIKETLGSFSSQQIVFTGFRTSPFFYVLIEKKKLFYFRNITYSIYARLALTESQHCFIADAD